MRILLIEDDHVLGSAIRDHITDEGHAIDWVTRLDDADDACMTVEFEMILLDLFLPDGRGLDFLDQIRKRKLEVPVVILTAQDQLEVRIDGLNRGADDYLVKPFDLLELSARIFAVSRRYNSNSSVALKFGDVYLDLAQRVVKHDEREVDLTAREWAVLDCLARRVGMLVPKSAIEDSLYPFGGEIESNAVEVYISRIRKKLGRSLITTIRNLGYRMVLSDG